MIKVIITVCICHLIKNMGSDINKICHSKKQKLFYKRSCGAVFSMIEFGCVKQWFKNIVLMKTAFKNEYTDEPYNKLRKSSIIPELNNELRKPVTAILNKPITGHFVRSRYLSTF